MCANCLSQSELMVGHVALAATVAKAPVHRLLADLGLVAAPDPVARDQRTVAFLRALDLDPVASLGPEAVARADARTSARTAPAAAGAAVPAPAPAAG
jgi:hypothetical protein